MSVIPFRGFEPYISKALFIAPNAWIIGKVIIEECASIFFGATLRGDLEEIRIGKGSNLQEQVTCHTTPGTPCIVGENVTVGHGAVLHSCNIKEKAIIGMGATLLDNCIIEENCIIGANSLVSQNTIIPAGTLAFGSPARPIRSLTSVEISQIQESADVYRSLADEYRKLLAR